mgnify:CR=1 FL=1
MFKDLKEYQEITQLYYDSVNISEEQREFNRRLDEQEFTEEEALYVLENIDEVTATVINDLQEEFQVLSEETLTEEDYLDLQEVLGSALAAGIGRKISTKIARKAGPAIRKGFKTMKTGAGDVLRGGAEVAKGAFKKVKGAVTSKTGKRVLGGLGALTGVGLLGGLVNNLRKKGKESRLKDEKKNQTEVKPPVQIGGGNAGGSTDSGGTAGGDKGGQKTPEPPKEVKPPKATETEKPKKKMSSIEKKNRARFGDAHVDKLKNKQKDFKKMKKGEMSKADFIKAYPKSITAQTAAGLRDHTEWDAYDKVLEYLFSTDQVDTIEEANYIMMEMDQETIGSIVYEVDEFLEEGFIDNLKAGVDKVKKVAGNVKDTAVKTTKKVVSKGKDILSSKNKVKTLNPLSKENKKIRDKKASMTDDNKGKTIAQINAIKRKRDGKSIADVKAENEAKMRAAARERNKNFKKK